MRSWVSKKRVICSMVPVAKPGSQLVNQFVGKRLFLRVGLPVKTGVGFVKLPIQTSVMFDKLHPWFRE